MTTFTRKQRERRKCVSKPSDIKIRQSVAFGWGDGGVLMVEHSAKLCFQYGVGYRPRFLSAI